MADTPPGTIILVNGSPSSGKTSIARAIQRTFDEPYLHLGIDLLFLDWSSYAPTATWMFDEAHKHTCGIYDLAVDTFRLTPTDCALEIKRVVDERGSPSAFKRLAALLTGSDG